MAELTPELQEKVNEFDKIIAEMREILIKKNSDYGKNNIGDLGERGIFCRIWDKVSRLRTLVWEGKVNQVKDESIEDTYKDLANYSIISIIFKRGKWN